MEHRYRLVQVALFTSALLSMVALCLLELVVLLWAWSLTDQASGVGTRADRIEVTTDLFEAPFGLSRTGVPVLVGFVVVGTWLVALGSVADARRATGSQDTVGGVGGWAWRSLLPARAAGRDGGWRYTLGLGWWLSLACVVGVVVWSAWPTDPVGAPTHVYVSGDGGVSAADRAQLAAQVTSAAAPWGWLPAGLVVLVFGVSSAWQVARARSAGDRIG